MAESNEMRGEHFDREDVEAVAACLGDDAVQLRDENDEDERADNMDRAASMLTWMLLTHPAYGAATPPASSEPEQRPSSALVDAAYDQIDRYLRNNLDDMDYADYSQALDLIYAHAPTKRSDATDAVPEPEFQEVSYGVDAVMRPVKGMAISDYAFRQWAKDVGIMLAARSALNQQNQEQSNG
jgi:hypothetical protein